MSGSRFDSASAQLSEVSTAELTAPQTATSTMTAPARTSIPDFSFKFDVPPVTTGGGLAVPLFPGLRDDPFRGGAMFKPSKGGKEKVRPNPMANLFEVFEYEGRTGKEYRHPVGAKAERGFVSALQTGSEFWGAPFGGSKAKRSKKSKRFKLW